MHIPDGFLDTKTILATSALSAVGVAMAWRRVKSEVPPQRVPLLGVAAAFVFAAQMLNFPVAGGTSGHLIGATLVSILLGPGAATIVIASVLLVQSFLFADGGILALGANIFNMALLGVISGYALYRLLRRILPGEWGNIAAVAIAAWASVLVSSVSCAGELAWSGTVQWHMAFPAMAGIHALIGVGEAAITCMVLGAIKAARPDILKPATTAGASRTAGDMVVYGASCYLSHHLPPNGPMGWKWSHRSSVSHRKHCTLSPCRSRLPVTRFPEWDPRLFRPLRRALSVSPQCCFFCLSWRECSRAGREHSHLTLTELDAPSYSGPF